jgi:hypothetical protein
MTATATAPWWPSPFGADDEVGMLNHVDDAKRREALALVRAGRLYDLGRVLDESVPDATSARPSSPPRTTRTRTGASAPTG